MNNDTNNMKLVKELLVWNGMLHNHDKKARGLI